MRSVLARHLRSERERASGGAGPVNVLLRNPAGEAERLAPEMAGDRSLAARLGRVAEGRSTEARPAARCSARQVS
jgi:hypothetical protein